MRSNYQEKEYREESQKLKMDEKNQMNELFEETIEKMTAAQIRGFESLDCLRQKHKMGKNKEKSVNIMAELLKKGKEENNTTTNELIEEDEEISSELAGQLQKRKYDQQEVILKIFRAKLDISEDEAMIPASKEFKRTGSNLPLHNISKPNESNREPPAIAEIPQEPENKKPLLSQYSQIIKIAECIGSDIIKLIQNKLLTFQKDLEYYYETSQKSSEINQNYVGNVHPSLVEYQTSSSKRFEEMNVNNSLEILAN